MPTKKTTAEGVPEAELVEATPPVPEPAPAAATAKGDSVIAFDTFIVGKFGGRRDRYAAFASHMKRTDPSLARRAQSEWEAEFTKFYNRPIRSV